MSWKTYQVVLRLRSPMHIGQMKLGNVQRTRGYVTGRVLWGALTERLTRDDLRGKEPATDSSKYQAMGKRVHEQLAFTYFYPTTDKNGTVDLWPWDEGFRRRFLSTYASTALTYPQQSAAEGTLHEVEFISPHTLDSGQPVYLSGYVFEREGSPPWKDALHRLQMGGERGYGWGRVEPIEGPKPWAGKPLFGRYTVEPGAWPPVLIAGEKAHLPAHALAADFEDDKAVEGVEGEVEPLVGRETCPKGRFGVQVSEARICYAPGSKVSKEARFAIGRYGVWQHATRNTQHATRNS